MSDLDDVVKAYGEGVDNPPWPYNRSVKSGTVGDYTVKSDVVYKPPLTHETYLRFRTSPINQQVREFMTQMQQYIGLTLGVPPDPIVRLRAELVIEEALEFVEACFDFSRFASLVPYREELVRLIRTQPVKVDVPKAVDALADTDYVVEGARIAFGVEGEPIARVVHEANMRKTQGPVDPITGKKLKPLGWVPPDIRGELAKQGWKEE